MELSGLIFVALALVWAVVLIPKALRHHDEVAQTRNVDAVSGTMRVLSRQTSAGSRDHKGPSEVAPPQIPSPRLPADVHRSAAAAAARRRRHILAALLLVSAGVGTAAGLGVLLPWAPAIPLGLTVAFLVLARVLVRREHARWRRTVAHQRRTAQRAGCDDSAGQLAPVPVAPTVVPVQPVAHEETPAATVVTGLEEIPAVPVALADAEPSVQTGALWDPLPMTLPTYVTKQRAARSVRTIDLSAPGVSSSGRDAAASALVAEAATSTQDEPVTPRAVGS